MTKKKEPTKTKKIVAKKEPKIKKEKVITPEVKEPIVEVVVEEPIAETAKEIVVEKEVETKTIEELAEDTTEETFPTDPVEEIQVVEDAEFKELSSLNKRKLKIKERYLASKK